jgi:Outer membrane protein
VKSGVRVLGPAQDDPVIQAAVQAFKPALNEPFVHSQYENSKAAVESALLSMGYLDARAVTQRVEISRARNSAQIDLAWQSGPRYRFGAVRFTGGQFPESFLHRFVPWPEGTFYTADWLLALQQRLTESGYFSSVSVLPATQETEGDTVPVDVLLVPGKRNAYRAASSTARTPGSASARTMSGAGSTSADTSCGRKSNTPSA